MRSAMSMIELVFAIVIMGIVVMSLPLVLLQTQRGNALALEQEVILATKTRLAFILSHEWDINSYDGDASTSRVLDTTASANADNAFDTTTTRRAGHIEADERRRLRDDKLTPTLKSGADWNATTPMDIDDFDGKTSSVSVTAADMDYIYSISLTSKIDYIGDALQSGAYASSSSITFTFNPTSTQTNPTNIKMISVTSSGSDANVTLRAFASNIGESGILKRSSW
ncbi:hypothetical protein SJPD1_1147 [Sulfurospirillum diekertiae]|uniref:Type II secretion system protein n=1 Tax=Sulfurospirillum diekertiae TaxID=1854492 RepID=A0A290HV67_9BACT|nr:hypothetical protein [Sulfurospirillum diekertiae]ATB69259.1 hypothetical protein SJPD1_1147 [Sulfurospirillum diekertiae]